LSLVKFIILFFPRFCLPLYGEIKICVTCGGEHGHRLSSIQLQTSQFSVLANTTKLRKQVHVLTTLSQLIYHYQ